MAEKATILIPDISGFTEFTSTTEIDHAAHIINELLELIVESNTIGLTLAEIEGDAVLFYLKEASPEPEKLTAQCLEIFRNFHQRLKVIERDTVCQCGACQTASNLTLKFIAHFGYIKEIKVAQFVKATGVDMIVAHRLMKNPIDAHEYILMTQSCCEGRTLPASAGLQWHPGEAEYPSIGAVPYQYTVLSDVRKQIPVPPQPDKFVTVLGDDNLTVEIQKPLFDVYQSLINVDERKNWMLGVDKINRDPVTERVGMQHNCVFMGMTMINTCLGCSFDTRHAEYIEQVAVPEISLDTIDTYHLEAKDDQTTHLNFNINWKETPISDEMKQGMLQGIMANLESLKKHVESEEL